MHPSVGARQPNMAPGGAYVSPASHAMARPAYGGQQQVQPPPQAFQGTLAPGTRLMIGQIVVTVQKYLSQGGFAHVYLVTTEKPIAMLVSATSAPGAPASSTRGETLHVLKRMAVPDKEALASVRGEVEVHKSLRLHPNIVHFIEASATALPGGGYEIFILMEYCAGGGIIDLMNARLRNRLKEGEVLKIFGDVAAGLSVMHHMDPPLMHRDLKVENILLAPPPRSNPSVGPTYKLCDFGSTIPILSRRPAKSLEEVKRLEADLNKCTTLQYRAPEMVDVYQRRVIDEKADVWAMGVLLYKLCYYTTPFEENGGGPLAILNAQYRFPPQPVYSQRLKDLIASMLQEQSTSRPTIDQIILGVHRILGTTPPPSTLHYAELASSGKQMQALPSVVSSTKPLPNSGADIAAMAIAKQQAGGSKTAPPAGGVEGNLIEIAPSAEEQSRLEQEELKKRSEGITPMRRGRPNRGTPTSNAASALGQSLGPPRSPSPTKESTGRGTTSNSQRSGTLPGFTDSFSPTTQEGAPAPPSRPASGMSYSPSLPGLVPSARASPLPKVTSPLSSTGKVASSDDDTTTRFPSVEELDLQYGTGTGAKNSAAPLSRSPASSTTTAASPPASANSFARSDARASYIPGLSERAPVSAMAGRFGSLSGSTSNTGSASSNSAPGFARRAPGPSSSSSLAKRWPHQEAASSLAKADTSNTLKDTPPPALPSRKPHLKEWAREEGEGESRKSSREAEDMAQLPKSNADGSAGRSPVQMAQESDSSDDEEAAKPEDVDEPVAAAARKRQSMMGRSLFDERREAAKDRYSTIPGDTKQALATLPPSGKIKKPEWLQQAKRSEEPAREADPAVLASSADSTRQEGEPQKKPIQTLNGTAARPPAWDEDDEEMHFLPQPDLNSNVYRQTGQMAIATGPALKKYVDASTSPGRGTPMTMSAAVEVPIVEAQAPEEGKPAMFVAPKPVRTQTSKDVGGLVRRYQDLSSNDVKEKDGEAKADAMKQNKSDGSGAQHHEQDILTNGSRTKTHTSALSPPAITAAKPTTWARKESDKGQASPLTMYNKPSLKPWEKEQLEKERVEKYGSLRSASPVKDEVRRKEADNAAVVNPDAQERFSGVSSLISQWQANAKKGAPGWGTVGGEAVSSSASSALAPTPMGRPKSKEDEDLMRRSSTMRSLAGARPMHGRIPSRDI